MSVRLNTQAQAPSAAKKPKIITQLGHERIDDYAWLRDGNWREVMADPSKLEPDIRAHLEAENAYCKTVMADAEGLKDMIFEELKGRLEPEESGVPDPDGNYAYYHRFRKGDQHGLYVRIPINPKTKAATGDEEIILDADALASETDGYFDLGSVTHSRDHQWLAYAVDRQGAENYEVFVKPMDGAGQSTGIKKSAGSLQWAADSLTLFWVERDENQRPYAVFARDAHEVSASAQLIYKENDPGFFVGVDESDSGAFIEISAHNHTTSEIWLVPADKPYTKPHCASPRKDRLEYSLHDQGGYFYVLTNAGEATDFQIMRAAQHGQSHKKWDPYIPHRPGTLILGLMAYKDFLVRLVRENALPKIIIRNMKDESEYVIDFEEEAYALGLTGGYEYDTPFMRFIYSSPTTPRQVLDYNMETQTREVRKTQVVPSGHTPEAYTTKRLIVTARDGEEIPVTLVMRSDFKTDGSAPVLLYGYGSYGITIPAGFRTTLLSLVDRGFIYAIAHIRGGKAKGYDWYLQGKLERKMNTFNDFVDVGRGLCEQNYTQPGRIVAHGGSAGGLLVGAALNQDPDLFGGIIAAVPFVDALNTMSDDTLPLTPPEWPEWGNPLEDETAYKQIKAYSPYDNIIDADYPPILITAGLTDPRVTYWEPAKWAAKLREHQTGDNPILLKTNMEAGHQGESGRYDSLKETALEYAFAVTVTGTD